MADAYESLVTSDNFKEKSSEINKYAKKLTPVYLKEAMSLALEDVGITSAQEYFIHTSGFLDAIELPASADMLTMRTGRLIGSLVGAVRFSAVKLPSTIEQLQKSGVVISGEDFGKGKSESIREIHIKTGGIIGIIGSKVPYAEKHEFSNREYLTPAIKEEMQQTIPEIFRRAVEETWKRENI